MSEDCALTNAILLTSRTALGEESWLCAIMVTAVNWYFPMTIITQFVIS